MSFRLLVSLFLVTVSISVAAPHALQAQPDVRRIKIALLETGPLLTVTGDLIAPIQTNVTSTPLTEATAAAGAQIVFCWTAAPDGGTVTGYRYGWDIADPNDDAQWEMPFSPFLTDEVCSEPITFAVSAHTFTIEVIDDSGNKSRVPIRIFVNGTTPVSTTTWGHVKMLYRDR